MRQIKSGIVLIIVLMSNLLYAQGTLQTDLILPYLAQQPAVINAHTPVIILMHGYGSNEADLFELKNVLPQNFLIISLRAPIAMGDNSFQWFRNETLNGINQGNRADIANSVLKVKAMIPALIKKYHVDALQVYLSGFSQGAMMCYEVGLTNPSLLKGIAPLSGRIFEALRTQIKTSVALKKLNIFIGHGDVDNRVNYKFAQESDAFLTGLGLTPELHTYKGLQHAINQDELNDLVKWLKAD